MKRLLSVVVILLTTLCGATDANAKSKMMPKMYLFGFSASFKNSVVYFTDIQEVDSAWMDTKTKFLLGRDMYSSQLKDYLGQSIQDPHRTCVVMFATSREKAEKKYMKLKKTYTVKAKSKDGYDVKHLGINEFRFKPVDMSPDVEESPKEIKKKEKKEKKEMDNERRGRGKGRGGKRPM